MSKRTIPTLILLIMSALLMSSHIRPYLMPDGYALKFREEFNLYDYKTWSPNTYNSEGNASIMTPEALSFDRSLLKITVDVNKDKQDSSAKSFTGGGLVSNTFYHHGKFSVRTKQDIKPGTVSSYFLMNAVKQGAESKLYEIEIKFLGKDGGQIQFIIQGDVAGKTIIQQDVYNLGFNFKKKFHDYTILWDKNSIAFYVDNRLAKQYEIALTQPLQIGVNHWAVNENEIIKWAGALDPGSLPSTVYYDWINYTPL